MKQTKTPKKRNTETYLSNKGKWPSVKSSSKNSNPISRRPPSTLKSDPEENNTKKTSLTAPKIKTKQKPNHNHKSKKKTPENKPQKQTNKNTHPNQQAEKQIPENKSQKQPNKNTHPNQLLGGWGLGGKHHKHTKGDTNNNSTKNRLNRLIRNIFIRNISIKSTQKQAILLSTIISLFTLSILLTLTSTANALPTLSINSPDHVTPQKSPLLNITAPGAATIWYSLDNKTNITIATGENAIAQNISLIANTGFETTISGNNSIPMHWQFRDSSTPIQWNQESYSLTPETPFGSKALLFVYDGNDSNDYLLQSMFIETGKKKFNIVFYTKPDMTFNGGNVSHGYCIDFIASEANYITNADEYFICFNNTDAWSFDEWASSPITDYQMIDIGSGWFRINFTTPEIPETKTHIAIALMPAYDDTTYTGTVTIDEISVSLDYGTHTLDIWANDTTGTAHSTKAFTISPFAPPKIRLLEPPDNTDIQKGTILDLNITSISTIENTSYDIGKGPTPIGYPPYRIDTTGWPSGPVTLKITAEDSNNLTTTETFHFPHVYDPYQKNTYFQKSYSITTGEPFHLAYLLTPNSTGPNTTTISLWGIYDTDNDNEITDEYTIQNTETIATSTDTTTYPTKLTIEISQNNTGQEILISWNTTIEPINFDLNRWADPLYSPDRSWTFASEKEYNFLLPTNFTINYTNIHSIWPYTSDGKITEIAIGMPDFEITSRGIEAAFEKIQGQTGIYSGKGEHNKKTRFDSAFIQFSNTTTKVIADLPFTKHLPSNLKIKDSYTRATSIIFDRDSEKAALYNFFSHGPLNGEAGEWVTFDSTSKQYNIPIQVEGLHISTQSSSLNAANLPSYTAGISFEKTGTTIDSDSFTHTGHIYAPGITSTLKRTITVTKNHQVLLAYTLTNNNTQHQSYEIWLADWVDTLKNDNLNTQYVFYANKNTTKELMHPEKKTRCIGIIEQQVHQSALYCPIEPYEYYIKNTNLYNNIFPLPPPIDSTLKLTYIPYTTLPSSSFRFRTNPVAPGKSATLSMYIYTSVSSEDEAGEETFTDAVTRMNINSIEKTYLQDTGSAEVLNAAGTLKELPIYVASNTLTGSNTRTIEIRNDAYWNYTIDETSLTIGTHRIIKSIKYKEEALTTQNYTYDNTTGTISTYNMKSTTGENTLEITYIPSTPQWSGMTASPGSPTEWKSYTEYTFNIDWTDDFSIESVEFKLDNKTYKNTTNTGSTYTYKTASLACGNHSYSWHANDTDGNEATTLEKEYIITGGSCAENEDTQNDNTASSTSSSSKTPESTDPQPKEESGQTTEPPTSSAPDDTATSNSEPKDTPTTNTAAQPSNITAKTGPLGLALSSFSTGMASPLKTLLISGMLILLVRNRDILKKVPLISPGQKSIHSSHTSLRKMRLRKIRNMTRPGIK